MMQCSLFQSLLSQAVESHAGLISPEVRTHATTCTTPACQQAWSEYSLLSWAIPLWQASFPQVDLTDCVIEELCPTHPADETLPPVGSPAPAFKAYVQQSWQDFRSPQQRSWSMALSVAGVMLLIGVLIVSIPESPKITLAVRPRKNPRLANPREHNVAVQSVEWAQKASSAMADVIVSIPEKGANWVPADTWDVDWQHKLEPLRREAHAAWDALIEDLPLPDQPSS